MGQRFQRGSLRKENRKLGGTWVLRYFTTREVDGKRVERTVAVGLLRDFPSESAAWAEVNRQHLNEQINKRDFTGKVTFSDLVQHYMQNELNDGADTIDPKAATTMCAYKHILKDYLLGQWGNRVALSIQPLEIEKWLQTLRRDRNLSNPTLDKTRRVMSNVYEHAQRHGLIRRSEECNPLKFVRCKTTSDYEAMIVTPEEAVAIMANLQEPERTLTLLASATGLRISECLGLQWADIDVEAQLISVRRTWVYGRFLGAPKTKASKAPVPLHPLLAEAVLSWQRETPYSKPGDWVFPSFKLKGKVPRNGSMLVEDYLRPAAIAAGVLRQNDLRRFGFHNLRHSLASFLVRSGTDIKTVQNLLRHANSHTTMQLYVHSASEDRLNAQGQVLASLLPRSNEAVA